MASIWIKLFYEYGISNTIIGVLILTEDMVSQNLSIHKFHDYIDKYFQLSVIHPYFQKKQNEGLNKDIYLLRKSNKTLWFVDSEKKLVNVGSIY